MNSFNKTQAAVFSCRLCFLRAFLFISLILLWKSIPVRVLRSSGISCWSVVYSTLHWTYQYFVCWLSCLFVWLQYAMFRERLPDLQWTMAKQHLYTGIVVGWFTLWQTRRTGKTAANSIRTHNEHFVVIIFTTLCCLFVCVLASPLFTLKYAMLVSFRSELFTSYILTIYKQWNLLP